MRHRTQESDVKTKYEAVQVSMYPAGHVVGAWLICEGDWDLYLDGNLIPSAGEEGEFQADAFIDAAVLSAWGIKRTAMVWLQRNE